MSPTVSPDAARDALAPFGALRPQPASAWDGNRPLPPALARYYAEVGPYGDEGPDGPEGLFVPTLGNAFWLPPLSGLWAFQAGYRWDGRSRERLSDWPDRWLVVADQGGDPFILDTAAGGILHAEHGAGAWEPVPIFPDLLVMAACLGAIGRLHAEAGADLLDDSFELRPPWRTALLARLAPFLGAAGSEAAAARLGW